MTRNKKRGPNPYKQANEAFLDAKAKEVGYGATKMDDIPAHSTHIFELKLVKIER